MASERTIDGDAPSCDVRPPEDDPLALGSEPNMDLQLADEHDAQSIRVEVVDWADAARQVWLRLRMPTLQRMAVHCSRPCTDIAVSVRVT
jgi:hypothetical protein